MKKILISILLLSGLNVSFANAPRTMEEATEQMSEVIGTEVQDFDSGLEENRFFETEAAASPFSFSAFELLTVASLGIEVPLLAGLEVFVEMEMVWEKVD